MATSDDTFDPNDLDSIDALLDEAELEAIIDDSEDLSVNATAMINEMREDFDVPVEPDLDDTDGLLDALDGMADSIDFPSVKVEPEASLVSPPFVERASVDSGTDVEDFIAKRAAAQSNKNPQMAASDMDSIKKLIIIFSSTLIVLVLTGIGIGVWSALAASSAGIDEETITMIETVSVNSQQGAISLQENTASVQSVEKKLDALSFQIEQLTTDLAAVAITQVQPATTEVITHKGVVKPGQGVIEDFHGAVNAHRAIIETSTKVVPTGAVTHVTTEVVPKTVAMDSAVLSKITSVNANMLKAQRRIDEVNSRVKSIQTQYQALSKSVKTLEKRIVMEQISKAETSDKDKQATDNSSYQYKAPDGMFYDQSLKDSYP